MNRLAAVIAAVAVFVSVPAFAAHPLITDDTGTVGAGKFQLEVNGGIGFDRENSGRVAARENSAEAGATLSAGVSENLDLVATLPFAWSRQFEDGVKLSSNAGISDVTLEAKWRFLEAGPVSFAVKPTLFLPTGDAARGLGNGRVSYGATLITTAALDPVALHLNLGYARNEFRRADDRESGRRNILHASLAATTEVAKGLQLVGNVGAESNPEKSERTWPAFILGGVIWSVNDSIDLDAGVKGGLTRPETDIAGLAGVTYHF